MANNTRLAKRVRRLMGKARMQFKATGKTATLFGETRSAARKWSRKRRLITRGSTPASVALPVGTGPFDFRGAPLRQTRGATHLRPPGR